MEIKVTVLPVADTTAREVASVASDAADALRSLRDVDEVAPVAAPAPGGAKGLAAELGSLLVSLPPTAISGAFAALNTVLARSPAATKVRITADGGVDLEFDPRRTSPADMAAMVNAIRAAHPR